MRRRCLLAPVQHMHIDLLEGFITLCDTQELLTNHAGLNCK